MKRYVKTSVYSTKWKKTIWKGYLSSTIWHSGKGKTKETVKRSGVARVTRGWGVRGEMIRQNTKNFGGGAENILYDTIMMDICHYTCVQMHRMCNTKDES